MNPENARKASRYTGQARPKLGVRSNAGGTMGNAALRSHAKKTTRTATPAATPAATRGERQVASEESTNPKVRSRSPEALSATPAVSKGRGTGSRDSAPANREMARVTPAIGTLTQKIDDHGNTLSSRPPTTLPPATAKPLTAAHSPIGPVLASGG